MKLGDPTLRVRTSVPAGWEHLEHLLDNAQDAIYRGRRDLAITHLSQAVLIASRVPGDTVDQLSLQRRVREIVGTGGGFA